MASESGDIVLSVSDPVPPKAAMLLHSEEPLEFANAVKFEQVDLAIVLSEKKPERHEKCDKHACLAEDPLRRRRRAGEKNAPENEDTGNQNGPRLPAECIVVEIAILGCLVLVTEAFVVWCHVMTSGTSRAQREVDGVNAVYPGDTLTWVLESP